MVDTPLSAGQHSQEIQFHLNLLQGIIQRMAENSRYCKIWCVTLVSAALFFIVRTEQPILLMIALVPTLSFMNLDMYYLALERGFRKTYEDFVSKLHGGNITESDIYVMRTTGSRGTHFAASLTSLSIWLFYPVIAGAILLAFVTLQFTDVISMCDCPPTAPAVS